MANISVIIPTYNRAEYLVKAVDSVLSQTYQDVEIIIIDDGSTDNTKEVLKKYTGKPQAIKYTYQNNAGAAAARNAGLKMAAGEYIAFLDSDDLWLPEKLEKQIKMMEDNPYFDMIFCDMRQECDGKIIYNSFLREVSKFNYKREINLEDLLARNFIFTPTILIKKKCFADGLMFNQKLQINEDYNMWLRIAQKFRIGFLDDILVVRGVHETNISRYLDKVFKSELETLKFFLLTCKNNKLRNKVKGRMKNITYNLGYYYFEKNRRLDALKYFAISLVSAKHILNNLILKHNLLKNIDFIF